MTKESVELIRMLLKHQYDGEKYRQNLMQGISHNCAAWIENDLSIKAAEKAIEEFEQLVNE